MGYHAYLTQLLVHHDIHIYSLDFYKHVEETYHSTITLYQFVSLPNGEFITRYPCGWAILNAPFILVGHLFALMLGYPVDGFSAPYQIAAFVSSLTYTLMGVFLLRKVLVHFFSEKQSALLLILVCLGTNFFHLNSATPGLIHIYLFPLYALLILQTIQFRKTHKLKNAIIIGGIIGLMTAARPTEIVAIFIPLLWGVGSKEALKNRIQEILKTEIKLYLWATLIGFCFIFPQLFYWKITTGSWLFYSYQNPGEGLDLLSPHTVPFLFSFRKGWWIYTPIMFFATLGFISLYKKNKNIFWTLFVFFILNLYLISSWTCWWYASSFSSRAMLQSYPIMAILLGYFLFKRRKWKIPLLVLSILFLVFNLFQTWQYYKGILPPDRVTLSYYKSTFGQTTPPTKKQQELLSIDHSLSEFKDYGNTQQYIKKTIPIFSQPVVISNRNIYSKAIKIPYKELTQKDYIWIHCVAVVTPFSISKNYSCHLAVNMLHNGKAYKWMSLPIQKLNLKPNKTDTITFDYLTPEIRSNEDELMIQFWHQSGDSIKIHNLKVEIWNPIE